MQYIVEPVGEAQANAYIVYEPGRGDALVIDPGAEPEAIMLALGGKRLAGILLTHGHFDHIGAVAALRNENAPVYIHEGDARMLTNPNLNLSIMIGKQYDQGEPDFCLTEGEIEIAGVRLLVLHTPGHTPGSVCFLCGDTLFSGDTLFQRGIGRTDLPGGDEGAMERSLMRLAEMDAGICVCPGHGDSTTIGDERRYLA